MIHFIPLLLFSISSSLTPGPNNLMIMNSGLNFGIRRSLPHYLGVVFGFCAMVFIVGLGLGALFTQQVWVQQVLKIAGAIYMLYLAWKIARSHVNTESNTKKAPITFFQAALFQWINPKAWTMAAGAIAIFSIASLSTIDNALFISATFLVSVWVSGLIWLLFGNLLQRVLKSDKHKKVFNYIMAIILVLSIALIFFE